MKLVLLNLMISAVEERKSLSVLARAERLLGAEGGQADDDRTAHGGRRALRRLPGGSGLEVRESVRGFPEIQGGEIRS